MQKKPLNPKAELLRLEALCNRAEHCSYEIAEKLRVNYAQRISSVADRRDA